MRRIKFLSFCSTKLNAGIRIVKQAENSGFYNEIKLFNEYNLPARASCYLSNLVKMGKVKGYGYWTWKPIIIDHYLDLANEGDIIHYADAGCHIIRQGGENFRRYCSIVSMHPSNILAFSTITDNSLRDAGFGRPIWIERNYTKSSVVKYFNLSEVELSTPQIEATTLFIQKSKSSCSIIKQWKELAYNQIELFEDNEIDEYTENGDNIQHRNDQSIFSILSKRSNVIVESSYQCQNIMYDKDGKIFADYDAIIDYPIHAKRDRGVKINHKILNKIKNFLLK
jgi:hypothetical protein